APSGGSIPAPLPSMRASTSIRPSSTTRQSSSQRVFSIECVQPSVNATAGTKARSVCPTKRQTPADTSRAAQRLQARAAPAPCVHQQEERRQREADLVGDRGRRDQQERCGGGEHAFPP